MEDEMQPPDVSFWGALPSAARLRVHPPHFSADSSRIFAVAQAWW
jgi:hypothetical protein